MKTTRSTRFNPYRVWAYDGKALSQYKEVPLQECSECHKKVDTRMELIDHKTGKCEACQSRKQ
jgi:hypothetical protein